ncbi:MULTISPECIES: BON domain-containing protein [Halomonadaceae]|jgi:osmotically-inducible protein OsmY|uniref:BON domain-containing protein n=1 Tax=Halomonadaceae TaxID=28256 RepID=UPI0015817AA4|nr:MULTISPECIES: BON domain-containing protein [Halomonas]MDI4637703.1 BON domain-containing protein [Halomonas sp. BMC7]NUJ58722.1 BON domain-containing protein [Halomonas taeanensis]
MRNAIIPTLVLALTLGLGGCTTIANVTNDGPIGENYGERTLGSKVEDESIQTKVSVNLGKTDARLADARINVNVFNGVVLLTGQVPSDELKNKAASVAEQVRNVRQVHNQLAIAANLPMSQRLSDGWLATRLKTSLATNENIDASRINIVVENASVYLMGLVTRAESERIVSAVSATGGVQRIVKVFEYLD